MESSFFDRLFQEWRSIFFSKPILLISMLLAFIVGVTVKNKRTSQIGFLIYIVSCFTIMLGTELIIVLFNKNGREAIIIIEVTNTIIASIELAVFYYFFFEIIMTKSIKILMLSLAIPFSLIVLFFFIRLIDLQFGGDSIKKLSFQINVIEFFLILLPCLTFFYEIFKKDADKILELNPAFWITSGVFIYCVSTLPFLLIAKNLLINDRPLYAFMAAAHYFSFTILFLSIIKSFRCKIIPMT